ncbi:hypothetical protein [Flammeovirga sp. EKP202]|uniref:hypothetical protein n=1 Tax=Flammeovirga sp. EKP202 TaxID=2770592 RepID=UPI00165F2A84|nr:hypothetical protein [Flammeovirga sp. EKP202]MBD0405122.1 hypothetical protein [Flammeovirga sp. EKP202]
MKLLKSSVLTIIVTLMMSWSLFAQQTKTVYYESKYMKNKTKKETPHMMKYQLEGDTVTVLQVRGHVLTEKSKVYPFKKLNKAEDFLSNLSKKKYKGKSYNYTHYNQLNKIVKNGSWVDGKRKVTQVTMKGEEMLTDGSGILEYIDVQDQTKVKVVYKNHTFTSKERVLTSGDTLMWITNPDQISKATFTGGMQVLSEKMHQEIRHSDFKIDETTKIYFKFIVDKNGKVKKDPRCKYTEVEEYIYSKVEEAGDWKPCILNNHAYAEEFILPFKFYQ